MTGIRVEVGYTARRIGLEGKPVYITAYIDPGSGSLLASLLVGGLAGVATFARYRWDAVKRLFKTARQPDQD